MSIVTFYSFKGGVGRSMALANVAVLLARKGARVLVIDWDLEAPGLEEYFDDFRVNADGRGLLFLLQDKDEFKSHVWQLSSTEDGVALDFLPAGRGEEDYYHTLERFSQEDFFASGGGDFLENLREEWLENYDFVLIDSRTGLSDSGGICTIQLPDIVIGLFTATRQSYRGVRDVLELAKASRQNLAYTRPQFSVVPVPCRINTSDAADLNSWMSEFSDAMDGLTVDWRPKTISSRALLDALRVEHSRAFIHGTRIVTPDATGGPTQALEAFSKLAELIESDLSDLSVLGLKTTAASYEPQAAFPKADDATDTNDWKIKTQEADVRGSNWAPSIQPHDVYFSVPAGSVESRWVEEFFLPTFRVNLGFELGRDVRLYFEHFEISAGKNWSQEIEEVMLTSRAMLAFVSPRAMRSKYWLSEIEFYIRQNKEGRVFPVLIGGENPPEPLRDLQYADMRQFFVAGDLEHYQASNFWQPFMDAVGDLSGTVAEHIGFTSD